MATKLKRNLEQTATGSLSVLINKKKERNPEKKKKKEYCVREGKIVFLLVENKYKLYKFSSLIHNNLIRPGIVIKKGKRWKEL